MSSWKQRSEFFKTMPRRSQVLFLLGIICLFGAIGSINDAMNLERSNSFSFAFAVVVNGVNAALWATIFTRGMFKWLLPMLVYQVLVFPKLSALVQSPARVLTLEQLRAGWTHHDVVVIVCIIAGYISFIVFFRAEARRYFAAHTEIKLASDIQSQLVPTISTRTNRFEFYGVSVPSGTVGGDLLDVVSNGSSFCAYVADVAGHGVPAGVVMSMVKSAVRMRVASVGPCDGNLLPALNEVLEPLTAANTYATLAYIAGDGGSQVKFSLAGHLPIFHYRASTRVIERHSIENFPVGMFPHVNYDAGGVDCEGGDLLLMITDGLTEILDRNGRELGYSYLEDALKQAHTKPLAELASHIMRVSEAFGPTADDRTLLMARCL